MCWPYVTIRPPTKGRYYLGGRKWWPVSLGAVRALWGRNAAVLLLLLRCCVQVASKSQAVGDMDMKGMSKLIQQLPQYR
jgi:hypothetical protein